MSTIPQFPRAPVFQFGLQCPRPVSSLAFADADVFLSGSDDGSVRVYKLPNTKVCKAIRGIGNEISCISWRKKKDEDGGEIWLAAGHQIISFNLSSSQMILSLKDAEVTLQVGEDEDDVLNELTLNHNATQLAFSTDSGTAGVLDLSSHSLTRMTTKHQNICGNVKFVPDRPSELVSGGYDSALLHHDFQQGTFLSRLDISSPPTTTGISLSPPFILSTSVSSTGLIAASTADGRVWIGTGGEKRSQATSGKKGKRSRKWEGLKEEGGLWVAVAEGPVVSVVFINSSTFLTCTLLGTLTCHSLSRIVDGDGTPSLQSKVEWTTEPEELAKVNSVSIQGDWIAVGGFNKDGKGLVEIWSTRIPQTSESRDGEDRIPENVSTM
ncbi:hypothetical protein JAAARDRAFT_124475 [Jaapia argillacea MUCL 33604]|uniref:Anaphase-promoting complex subunit 4 WD40 domain-containing protein n=1 Tax=Jaapia argillacea MUCL 33604 TaxID=933084 RepID=A0A067Q121_9AGAM|nr:hypothetical protein JAAARDRAFT_124475 [Jaapia argillacea MUCL 33604]